MLFRSPETLNVCDPKLKAKERRQSGKDISYENGKAIHFTLLYTLLEHVFTINLFYVPHRMPFVASFHTLLALINLNTKNSGSGSCGTWSETNRLL